MFIKKKRSLITILVAIFAAVFLCVGITLLTPKTKTAQAVSDESGSFRIYDNSDSFIEGHEDISSAWYAAREISFDIRGVATVKMFADATISDTLSVNSRNIHIALDLNGHKLSIDSEGKSVISSYGLFTLKDSNPGATNTVISYARGNSPQTVTVSGGVITGAYGNAAVLIGTGGCSMEGGTIAGNVSTRQYSAALHVGNSFDLTGGTITENLNVAGGGGGMYAQGININISGAVKIEGNSSCTDINDSERNAGNFYFDYNATLVVNGALNDGEGNNTRIGVTCGSDYPYGAEITKDYLTYHSGVAPDSYFYSDTPDKCTQLVRNEVYIYRHSCSGSYTVEGDKHYRTCSNCKETVYEVHNYSKTTGVCVCGAKAEAIVTGTDGFSEFYATVEDAFAAANNNSDLTAPFTVKLFFDVITESLITVDEGKNITLDLNGCEIKYTGASGSVIKVDGTFKLEDNKGTGSHTITSPVTNETVTISGGLITGGKGTVVSSTVLGGAVYVKGTGVFTMNGGTLAGNTARTGGGVYNNGTFTMNGGRITCNMAGEGLGGGVYNNGTFSVSGAPEIMGNTANGNVCNVTLNQRITFAGELTDGAKIGVRSGMVATGYAQSDKPAKYFIPDNSANDCVYAKEGNVTIGKHTGGTATCVSAKTCANCGEEYGEIDGEAHTLDKLVILSATDTYSAFDLFDTQTAEVYTHCLFCNQNIDKLAAKDISVTYSNGNCLHADDTHVSLSASVGGQTLYSDEYSITVNKCGATIVWEYTTSEVSAENAWVWNEITEGSHFVYDGTSKSYRVRARFTGADNDPDKDTYYYRAVDNTLLVDGNGEKGIENAAVYVLSLDGSKFADYSLTNNSKSIEVKPYEITLSDAEVYRWTLGSDKGSLLRNAYIEKTEDDVYLYYDPTTGNAEGRTYVTRSVVRYRGESTGLDIVLNGGEIADLFAGTGKRSNIEYSGTTAVGAVGKYTAIATLTLNDVSNYRYVGEITVADSRGMTIVISENGTKAVITKDWYVATIMNGLLMPDSGEYSVSGWVFGEDFTATVPMLEHGDENFDLNNIAESDKRISFGLFTDVDMTEIIGKTFYRYNFAEYINKSMPCGNYVLRVSVSEVTDSDGLAYQAFTRTFTFTVKKGTLGVTDTLNGKEFEYVYNGKVQLFESQFEPTVAPLKYASASDRIGIWQNSEYDNYYGAALITFHLARWQAEGGVGYEFVTRTQLENTLDRKQAPREVDTYTVQYKISALNYEDYGGGTDFTVKITKRQVAVPSNVTETLIKEYVYDVPQNADYRIEGNATFTQVGTHTVTLKLIDADNYEWEAGDNVEGNTATVTVTLTMHAHIYGEWQVDIKPTCTEKGSRSKKCTLCGDVAEEEVDALGHNLTQHKAKPATCAEKGWSAYETCSRCNHTTYEEIAALGHNLTHVEYKEATAHSAGNIEYWACADCAEYFSDEDGETVITDKATVEIPMLVTQNNGVNGLSAGAIAGIVIACVIVALVAAYVAGYFLLYRKEILLKGKAFDAIYVPMNAIFNKKIEE